MPKLLKPRRTVGGGVLKWDWKTHDTSGALKCFGGISKEPTQVRDQVDVKTETD